MAGLIVVLAAVAILPTDASAASWYWWRKFDASLSVTQSASWSTASTRPCGLTGEGRWVFDARAGRPSPIRLEFLGGGYVTKGEGGYRVFDVGRHRHYALPATGTATAQVTQQPSDDPDFGCDEVPNLTDCGTRAFPRRYTGDFLLGQQPVGRLTLHVEDIRDPDELPGSTEFPCLRIDPRLPGAGRQLGLIGTDLPVRRVFRRRSVTFRGERAWRPRSYGVEIGGVLVDATLSVEVSWELRLRARGRAHAQCSYQTRRNRCPRV
jgi:hypothetical protein